MRKVAEAEPEAYEANHSFRWAVFRIAIIGYLLEYRLGEKYKILGGYLRTATLHLLAG